jgi:hypothetical protein
MRNAFQGFDIDAAVKQINTFTLNVHDSRMMTPTLAKVILTYTGSPESKDQVHQTIARMFNGYAAAVEDSFRILDDAGELKTTIGFVRANREVRPYDKDTSKGMRVVASNTNLLMDKKDESVWEVRKGASGTYIAKQGNEDLSELVHLATVSKGGYAPKFAQTAAIPAQPKEFVAYVSTISEEVEHGWVVSSVQAAADTGKPAHLVVVAQGLEEPMRIGLAQVIDIRHLDKADLSTVGMKMSTAAMDKGAMVNYYRKAFSFAPDYLAKIIQQINEMSFA